MRPNGLYVVSESSQAISTADVLIELQVPSAVLIEIWRMWVGAAENDTLVDAVQEIDIYANDAAGTSGTSLTGVEIQTEVDAATLVTAVGGPTIGATPTVLYPDGFHVQNGWLYLPVPEERIRIRGGGSVDNVGFRFPTAPGSSITVSYGIIYAEYA